MTTTSIVTTNSQTHRLRSRGYPADYDVYESDVAAISAPFKQVATRAVEEAPGASNPLWWPDNYRRIPAYRPINRNLDQNQRRVYTSFGERVFLTAMFTGVEVNVVRGVSPSALASQISWLLFAR